MTRKQLNDLGFEIDEFGRVWHFETESEYRVKDWKKIKAPEFITRFFNYGFDKGKEWGKEQYKKEIKNILGIN